MSSPLQDGSIARLKNAPFSSSAVDLSYLNIVQPPSQKKDRQECHDEREPSVSRAAPEPGNLAAQLPHHLPQIASSTILFQGEALDVFAELFFGVEHADEHADSGGDAAVDDRVVEKHMCGLRNVVDCLDCHEVRPEPGAGFF